MNEQKKWNQKMGISKREYGEPTPKNPQPRNDARRKARQKKSK